MAEPTPAWRSRPVMILVAVAVTVIAVWLTVRGQDLGQVRAAFGQLSYWPYIFSFLGLVLGTLSRAARFHILIRRGAGSRFVHSLEMIFIGYLFTTLLPLRTGELVRVGYMSRRSGEPLLSVTSATVAERGMDLLALAFIGAVFLSGVVGQQIQGLPFPPWVLGAAAGGGVVGAVLVGLLVQRRESSRGGESKLARILDDLLGGLRALGSPRDMAMVLVLSLVLWLVVSLSMKIAFISVDRVVPFSDAVVVMLGTCFAIALPGTPGFVGTYHLGFVTGALLVGIPREVSIPVAVLFHLVIQVPFLPVGGLILFTGGRRPLARPPEALDQK